MPNPVVFPFKAVGQKDVENAFKSIASAAEKSSKTVTKEVDSQGKALDKLAKQVDKTSKSIEKARVESSKKATEQILQDYEKQAKAAEKLAERMDKAFEKHNSNKKSKYEAFVGKYGGAAKTAAMAGGAAIAGVVIAATREAIQLDEMANRIAISARGAGQKMVDPAALRRSFEETAIKTPGIKSEEVAAGTAAFVSKTGRLDIAQQMQNTFATAASASGAKMEEIATAAADLFDKFDIKSVEEMQNAFSKLIFQGKEGSFELKDAASQFARLSASAASFNIGKGAQAVATLGGLTQIAKRATGSPEAAATAVESMFSRLTQQSTKLGASGVRVYDKGGASRNIQDVLVDTITMVGKGDMAKKKAGLGQIFGEQGIRAINPLIQTFEEAFSGAKKEGKNETEALSLAQKALREEFNKTINAAGSWKEVVQDSSAAQTSASAQLTAAWEEIKKSAGENLAEPLKNLAPKVAQLAPAFALLLTALGSVADEIASIFPESTVAYQRRTAKEQEYINARRAELTPAGGTGPILESDQKELDSLDARQAALDAHKKLPTFEEFNKKVTELGHGRSENREVNREVYDSIIKDQKIPNFTTGHKDQFAYVNSVINDIKSNPDVAAQADAAKAQMEAAQQTKEAASALKEVALISKMNNPTLYSPLANME